MSSYIQRLISRGVESFSDTSSLSSVSVAKSQSPLVKNDQRLHHLDISHTVDMPTGSMSDGEDFDNNQFPQLPEQNISAVDTPVGNNRLNKKQSRSEQKSISPKSEPINFSDNKRSRDLYNSSLINRNNRPDNNPKSADKKIIERNEIYQSPIVHEHVTENHIHKTEQPETIRYVELPQRSVHSLEPRSSGNIKVANSDSSNNQNASLDIDNIISKLDRTTSASQQTFQEPLVSQDNAKPSLKQVELQEIKATAPINSIVQEYDSDNQSSPVKPTVIEKVIEKVVEKEVVNKHIHEASSKLDKPATAESVSKIGSLPIRNSVFSIFGSRG